MSWTHPQVPQVAEHKVDPLGRAIVHLVISRREHKEPNERYPQLLRFLRGLREGRVVLDWRVSSVLLDCLR
jgi:hypothetical protein